MISLSEQPLSQQAFDDKPQLGLLIAAARRSIRQAASERLKRHRLSSPQFWLLVAIHERPGLSLGELAGRRLMDSPTASRVVSRLMRRGFVSIEPDPRDRRRRSIQLTPRGRALARELHPLALSIRQALAQGFAPAEVEALRGMLLRVIANLGRLDLERRPAARRRRALGVTA
jgi:DNA-binding MarR family transcriptional regulator